MTNLKKTAMPVIKKKKVFMSICHILPFSVETNYAVPSLAEVIPNTPGASEASFMFRGRRLVGRHVPLMDGAVCRVVKEEGTAECLSYAVQGPGPVAALWLWDHDSHPDCALATTIASWAAISSAIHSCPPSVTPAPTKRVRSVTPQRAATSTTATLTSPRPKKSPSGSHRTEK